MSLVNWSAGRSVLFFRELLQVVVRFVGDSLAVVFAETAAQAEDAANAIWADIDPLPVVVDPEAALLRDAEIIFPVHGSNQAMMIPDSTVTTAMITERVSEL